ncbi:MAG TPA: hypothetical protein VNX60_09115 [Candidatus Acidoferrum sp.]|nr:hypothetical protein [Candidatus Acidoferrum sp.]
MAGGVRARGALAGFGRKHPDALQIRFSTKERRRCVLNAHAHEAIHQLSTEEEPTKAVDPPEPTPSVLSMGIPHCVLQPGPRYAQFDGTQLSTFYITTECARASRLLAICFGLAMMPLFFWPKLLIYPCPSEREDFAVQAIRAMTAVQVRPVGMKFLVVRRALQLDESVQLRILLGNSPRFEASECADRVKRKITDDWTLERSSAARSR